MTRTLDIDAEIDKLALTLSCSPADLTEWSRIGDVAVMRQVAQATRRRLATSEGKRLRGVVAAARRLPPKLVAAIAEHHFGPVLCAATLASVDGDLAAKVSRHLTVPFMVEIVEASEPQSAAHLATHLPRRVVVSIARELIERRADVTLAAFADHVAPEIIVDVLRDVPDHAAVVRIARFMDDRIRIDPIVSGLSDAHLEAVIDSVATNGLWVEGLDLIGALGPEQTARLALIAAELHDDVLNSVVDVAADHDLWPDLIGMVRCLGSDQIARIGGLDALADADRWAGLVRTAIREEIVHEVLEIVAVLAPAARRHIAGAIERSETGDRAALVAMVFEVDAWSSVGLLLDDLEVDDRIRLALSLLDGLDVDARVAMAEQLIIVERVEIVAEVLGRLPVRQRRAIDAALDVRRPDWRLALA